jgi:hypothetical protein
MKCYILTGISRKVIEDIARRAIRTVELRSTHNVSTAMRIDVGSCVFLTPCRHYDLDKGVMGVIAEVNGKESQSHSMVFASERYIEESEMTVVRLRLSPKGVGRLKNIYSDGILESTEGEIVEVSYFRAR